MFKEEIMIKTLDNKLHNSVKEAENYIIDKVCEELNEYIKKAETFDLKYRDLVVIIKELAGNTSKLKRLHKLITTYVDQEEL